MTVFFSNQVEQLYQRFKELSFPSSPFAQHWLVVPNPAVKSWLMLQLARDPEVGIAAGFEVLYLTQAVEKLKLLLIPNANAKAIPSSLEMKLAIEVEIKKVITSYSSLSEPEQQQWAPLLAYLKLSESLNISRKSERRLVALAEKLSSLFINYGIYGARMVGHWESRGIPGWQQQLWRNLFDAASPWSYPARELSMKLGETSVQLPDLQISIFAQSFISRLHHAFLTEACHSIPIHYFLLSPCRAFWSDIHSDREQQRIMRRWQKQTAQTEQLEDYLRERNPLLANYGRLGREMAAQIEESSLNTDEAYVISAAAASIPQYTDMLDEELIFTETTHSLTLLEAVQADMLLLRNPESQPKIDLAADQTIQLHVASSLMREMEILYNNLLGLIDKKSGKDEPLCPGEIIVMAPDIMRYEPYIRAIFDHPESRLDWQLMDLQIASQSSLVQGLLALLNLSSTRWEASAFLQLFDNPEFRKRQGFSDEELSTFSKWIKESGIRWGEDYNHRNQMLQRDHCSKEMIEQSSTGTWDYGISRLLYGLAMVLENDQDSHQLETLPCTGIEMTQSDLLGKLIGLLRSLREDLRPLTQGTELPLGEWVSYLNCLCDAYFSVDQDGQEELKTLRTHLTNLANGTKRMPEAQFSFTSVKKHLEFLLKQETVSSRENHLQAVRFCSMLPMRAIPAKVICLMGMEEGSYPKFEGSLSLNLMASFQPSCDFCPSSIDYDRFLFLETLLSVRHTLLISYAAVNHQEVFPSLLVTELLNYLDKSYTMEGESISRQITVEHPYHPFDKKYFANDARLKCYSSRHYNAAQAHYTLAKSEPSSFMPEFLTGNFFDESKSEEKETRLLDIKLLSDFARNPLRSYFKKTLGIYLKNEEAIESDEPLILSNLDKGRIRKIALTKSIEEQLLLAEKRGELPLGPFKEIAKESLRQEVENTRTNLAEQGISPEEITEIEFSLSCKAPYKDEKEVWHYPPVEIDHRGKKMKIIGKVKDVTKKGLVVNGKDSKDLYKVWPQLLLTQICFASDQAIYTKKGKSEVHGIKNPQKALQDYVSYYYSAQQNGSLLLPEFIPTLLNKDQLEFHEELKDNLSENPRDHAYNDELKWAFKQDHLPNTSSLFEKLQGQAKILFEQMMEET